MLKDLLQGKPLGHPLHPLLIHFPISLFLLSFAFDVAVVFGWGPAVFAPASVYALLLGIVMALLAALTGLADYLGIRRDTSAKRIATWHMILNLLAVALYALSVWLRFRKGVELSPSGWALLFSLAALGVLGASGYLGGKLVYELGIAVGRHRRRKPAPMDTLRVEVGGDGFAVIGPTSLVREGETVRVDAGGTVMAVTCLDGQFYAFQDYCTHRYGPLSEGALQDGEVMCPWHRSCFDIRTGKVTQGPAKVDLRTYPVEVSGDGMLRVRAGAGASTGSDAGVA